jgi:hypothetical protein
MESCDTGWHRTCRQPTPRLENSASGATMPKKAECPRFVSLLAGTPCVLFPEKAWGGRRSWDDLRWLLYLSIDVMPKSGASVPIDCKILYRELLPSRPPHDRFGDLDTLLIRQRNGQRQRFPWSHRQIPGKSPAGTGKIPHGALPLEWPGIVGDGALNRESTVGTNGEGHRGLATRHIVGGGQRIAQEAMRGCPSPPVFSIRPLCYRE